MKLRFHTLITLLLFAALAISASAAQSTPKPGFPAGTWVGGGYGEAEIALDGDLITLLSTNLTFTLNVSRNGRVTGEGTLRTLQTGSGSVGSRITGVANVTFSGTPINVRYSGSQVVTTKFIDAEHVQGTKFTRDISGGLAIKKARSCRVTGGHIARGDGPTVRFNWQARLKGVSCR